jgi:hypothetical protein
MEQNNENQGPALWRTVLGWIGGFALLVFIALVMVWVGSLVK